MILTMQRLLSGGKLADMLNTHADDIGAQGSGYDFARCMEKVEEAYRRIARAAAIAECYELEDDLVFTPSGTGREKTFAWPTRIGVLRSIEGWNQSTSTPTRLIYNREFYDRPGYRMPNGYHISGSYFKVYEPSDTLFKATFYRAPGALAYGACGASSTTTRIYLGAPTAGMLEGEPDAYVGDRIAVIYASGTIATRRITAYSAVDGYVDIESDNALGTAPGASDEWSFIPFMRDSEAVMLIQGTAAMFDDAPNAGVNMAKFQESLDAYISAMKPVDTATPATVRQVHPGPDLTSVYGDSGRSDFGKIPY